MYGQCQWRLNCISEYFQLHGDKNFSLLDIEYVWLFVYFSTFTCNGISIWLLRRLQNLFLLYITVCSFPAFSICTSMSSTKLYLLLKKACLYVLLLKTSRSYILGHIFLKEQELETPLLCLVFGFFVFEILDVEVHEPYN